MRSISIVGFTGDVLVNGALTASWIGDDSIDDGRQGRRIRWGVTLEPGDVGFAPEPGGLALGELPVALGVQVDRRFAGQLAVDHGPRLAIADRAEGGQPRVVALAQGLRLVDEAGVELRLRPQRDAMRVDVRRGPEADPGHR